MTQLRAFVAGCLAALAVAGGPTPATADPDPACGSARVFAVEASTGHLAQLRSCPGSPAPLGPAVEVDTTDWRAYPAMFAAYDGNAVILYAVTATGELWWRRQDAPGAALSAPVRVAGAIDWRHDVIFAPRPGHLALGDFDGPVRTFRHDGWTSGGTAVAEEGQLFTAFHGPAITAVAPGTGYAVGVWDALSYCVWRYEDDPAGLGHDDVWFISGRLPAGVRGVTGDGTWLYGVDSAGGVVLLRSPGECSLPLHNLVPWSVTARAPGRFGRVVVPIAGDPAWPPSVAPLPSMPSGPPSLCGPLNPDPHCVLPWEWQA